MIPTWDEMHAAILQQMDESEKTTGVRKTTKGALAKKFGWTQNHAKYYIHKKYASEFVAAGFDIVSKGRHGGIYMKDNVGAFQQNNIADALSSDNVSSLIDRLDAPVEKKSIETLLAEQIRFQLDRNAQFSDRILQIAMGA